MNAALPADCLSSSVTVSANAPPATSGVPSPPTCSSVSATTPVPSKRMSSRTSIVTVFSPVSPSSQTSAASLKANRDFPSLSSSVVASASSETFSSTRPDAASVRATATTTEPTFSFTVRTAAVKPTLPGFQRE